MIHHSGSGYVGGMITTVNGRVGCRPFSRRDQGPTQVSKGLVGIAHRTELVPLEVMVADDEGKYPVGSTVYVRGEDSRSPWASPLLIGEDQVILVPVESICALSRIGFRIMGG